MYQRATLANGLRIICEPIPHMNSVALGVWVGTGSRYEGPEYNGISHFIEHMLFKGTHERTARQIAEAIDAVGGQLNAFTTKEYTCFYAKVLSQHFTLGIDLLSDMVTNSVFDSSEIEKEKQVVLEEIKSFEDSPDEVIQDLFAAAVLKGHPLGWTILGLPEMVRRFNKQVILDYLTQHYTPDNIVFAAAGNVQIDQIVTEIEKRFSGLQGSMQQTLPMVPEPEPDLLLKSKAIEQVHLCIGARGVCRKSPDKYGVFMLDSLLGGSVSSRLFQQLREERGLVYVTGSNHSSYKDTGVFSIYAGTRLKNFEEVVSLIKKELNLLIRETVPEEELNRNKEQLKGNLLLSLDSTSNRMSRLAKTELFGDQLFTPEEIVAKIDAVTSSEVQRLAGQLLGDEKQFLTALGPFKGHSKYLRRSYHEY
ncbi:MAG TPA: peptidase M16 [Firmicutes bacterium]|jgi:predicted Zn-dependent peptidase|nr:peptidase M16 [Bacillota bacterium]